MTPAQIKAKELVDTFGKELAPKVVDEIINENERGGGRFERIKFYEEVKNEINNL
jgi:hypothetical protein